MAGDGTLFTREDAVEAAWAVVDPVLKKHTRARPYKRGSWGPKEADADLSVQAVPGTTLDPKRKSKNEPVAATPQPTLIAADQNCRMIREDVKPSTLDPLELLTRFLWRKHQHLHCANRSMCSGGSNVASLGTLAIWRPVK